MKRREFLTAVAGSLVAPVFPRRSAGRWQAGVATANITPEGSLWMAGFARRTLPAQGVALPLHAKALALDGGGGPSVLVTVDLLGLTAEITGRVAAEASRRYGIERAALLFNASHTHCGPVVNSQLAIAYDLTDAQWAAIRDYTGLLEEKLAALVGEALSRLRPADLALGRAEAGFARNRRVRFTPDGPVDHSVPVLRVDAGGTAPLAVVFGYACHNTTLQDAFVQYHGDYAGVAQAELEKRHRGTTALFVAGCGADANPHPRGTLELVNAHGAALADAVDRALRGAAPVPPGLHAGYGVVDLPFASQEDRERWRRSLDVEAVYLQRHAALMESLARKGAVPAAQPAPVQVWRFGPAPAAPGSAVAAAGQGFTLVALGGEVVVDYALRLAREYPARRIWAAGYSNDVFGYLPSRRVLREGGYEGADAMIYYGRPGPFSEGVEELIMGEVRRLVART